MLATLGGGSARGFGYGLPSGGLTFEQTGMVYQVSGTEVLKFNATAGINGNNEAVKNTSFKSAGHFPAQVVDVAYSVDDLSVKRLICIHTDNASINTIPLDFTSSTSAVNTSHGYLSNTRALMQLRNGVIVSSNYGNRMSTWKLNTNGTVSKYTDLNDNGSFVKIQCIINPNDGAEIGDSTHIFVSGFDGGRIDVVRIDGNGDINVLNGVFQSASAGSTIWMSPMKSTDSDKLRFMAFFANTNTRVIDYSISNDSFSTVSTGTSLSMNTYGRVISATPAWGGFTWAGFADENNTGTNRVGMFYQNGNHATSTTSSSYTMDYNSAILAIEDTSSASNINGHVYWGGFNDNNDPQEKLLAANDAASVSIAGVELSNARLTNNSHTVGGGVIGERPRYAEMDAKLESTHW